MDAGQGDWVDASAEDEIGREAPVNEGQAGDYPVKGGVDLEAGWLSLAGGVAASQNNDGIGSGRE